MISATLTQILYCFCVLSALLLIGTLLRGLIPVFQRLFLPASVIGGFIGLFVGPIIWRNLSIPLNGIPFPQEWINTWSALPGILIVPVIASTPLGMKIRQTGKTSANVMKMFSLLFAIGGVQILLGLTGRQVEADGAFD